MAIAGDVVYGALRLALLICVLGIAGKALNAIRACVMTIGTDAATISMKPVRHAMVMAIYII
jgi:hypothetical protein